MKKITVIGLGAGSFDLLTLKTWDIIQNAKTLLLRTAIHPTVDELKKRQIQFFSYDDFYEHAENFDELYKKIVQDILRRAEENEIVYAVPGSPLVAEKTVQLLTQEKNISLEIIPAMSFLEVMFTKLGIDPVAASIKIFNAELFSKNDVLDRAAGNIFAQVYNRKIASDLKLTLMENFGYDDETEIFFVNRVGLPNEIIKKIPLYELDRQKEIDYLTSLYIPPQKNSAQVFQPLVDVMKRLRNKENGCPWDLVQTHETLRKNLLEETYEVLEAIDNHDEKNLCEELGDLLLQIVFHAQIASEENSFTMDDVVRTITEKLIRRHPHIFGTVHVENADEVLSNWEKIKKTEKPERKKILDGVLKNLPALMLAKKLQDRAKQVGFDFETMEQAFEKFEEELQELQQAIAEKNAKHIEEEFGDVLFALVNVARFLKIDAEISLLQTNEKFTRRFNFVEEKVLQSKKNWQDFSLNELDNFWNEAKHETNH